MVAILLRVKDFSLKWIVPVIDAALFYMAIFAAIYELLLWQLIEPWLNTNLHRLLDLFFMSWIVVQVNIDWFFFAIPRVLRLFSIIFMVFMFNKFNQRRFWFAILPLSGILLINWLSRYWSVAQSFSELRFLHFSAVVAAGIYLHWNYQPG
jgi:hypothetical protein